MARFAVGFTLLWLSAVVLAEPFFNVVETEYTGGPVKVKIQVEPALRWDAQGKPHFNLHPDSVPDHARLISILTPGIPFDEPAVQDQVAEFLGQFPIACLGHGRSGTRQGLGLSLLITPIEYIDRFVPGVVDKRRITGVYVNNCLAERLPSCLYDQSETGAEDFDLRMFYGVLRACRDATMAAVHNGEPYADWVYAANPQLRKPAAGAPRKLLGEAP